MVDSFAALIAAKGGGIVGGFLFFLIYMAVIVIVIASQWKIFVKAGKPGWACLIPIYNVIVLLEIVRKPLWWIVLFFVPFVNFVIAIMITLELAKMFGQGMGFAVGMILLPFIFYPILGFGSAQYAGGGMSMPRPMMGGTGMPMAPPPMGGMAPPMAPPPMGGMAPPPAAPMATPPAAPMATPPPAPPTPPPAPPTPPPPGV